MTTSPWFDESYDDSPPAPTEAVCDECWLVSNRELIRDGLCGNCFEGRSVAQIREDEEFELPCGCSVDGEFLCDEHIPCSCWCSTCGCHGDCDDYSDVVLPDPAEVFELGTDPEHAFSEAGFTYEIQQSADRVGETLLKVSADLSAFDKAFKTLTGMWPER